MIICVRGDAAVYKPAARQSHKGTLNHVQSLILGNDNNHGTASCSYFTALFTTIFGCALSTYRTVCRKSVLCYAGGGLTHLVLPCLSIASFSPVLDLISCCFINSAASVYSVYRVYGSAQCCPGPAHSLTAYSLTHPELLPSSAHSIHSTCPILVYNVFIFYTVFLLCLSMFRYAIRTMVSQLPTVFSTVACCFSTLKSSLSSSCDLIVYLPNSLLKV